MFSDRAIHFVTAHMRRVLSTCWSGACQPSCNGFVRAAQTYSSTWQQQLQQQQHQCCQPGQVEQPAATIGRDRTWDASCSPAAACTADRVQCAQQEQYQQQEQQQWHQPWAPLSQTRLLQQGYQRQLHTHRHLCQQEVFPGQQQPWRGFSTRPLVNPTMPPALATVITEHAAIRAERPSPPPLEPRPLTFESRRSGVIAIKAGMMQDWDEYGVRVPLTVLWVDECMVLRHKHFKRDGVTSLVLACGVKKAKQLHPRQLGEFQAAGLPLKRKLWECKVTDDAVMPPGTLIGAAHFRAGQYLDITGTTKGKGFAGVMKRWNFAGQGASHGNTKHHRAPGSIGGRTDPGRVWKGKKMPGRLGGESMTFKNIWLYKVDPERNLLYVRGQVPGPQGSFVLVRDAFRWRWTERHAAELPFPTHIGDLPPVTVAKRDGADPYRVYREDIGYFEANWKGD